VFVICLYLQKIQKISFLHTALNCSFLVLQKQNKTKKVEYLAATVWTSNFFLLSSVGTGSVQIL
jgi:hypothetical protein